MNFFLLILIGVTCRMVKSELFTSLAAMEDLLVSEQVLIDNLANYIGREEKKLNELKSMLDVYSRNHKKASTNIGKYLENPIHAFQMIKRVTSDWVEVEKLVTYDNMMEMIHNISYQKSAFKFATEEDLNGAAIAIIHLQDVYQLNTTEIAQGTLNGVDYNSNMTTSDCFEMGKQAFKTGDFNASIDWLRLAKTYSNVENKTNDSDLKENILEFLLRSLQREDHMAVALNLTQEYLKLYPKDTKAKYNKEMIEEDIRRFGKKSEVKSLEDLKLVRTKEVDAYLELCRGVANADMSLTCNYEMSNTPFLKLAPLKVEVLHQAPQILMFHDVLSDKEIGLLKKQAQPKLERSKVFNIQTNRTENSSKRLSKEARIESKKNEPVTIIGERVAAMTGLSLATAEELQLTNYGVGGYYEAHYDFVSVGEQAVFEAPVSGNRVATVLFYLTDVQQGGATVFPELNLVVPPKKGAVIFWHNLFRYGEEDRRMQHAACPVLYGSKWVANKWFHEHGQEHHRPCGLTPDYPV